MKQWNISKSDVVGAVVAIFGIIVVLIAMRDDNEGYADLIGGFVVLVIGAFIAIGERFKKLKFGKDGAEVEMAQTEHPPDSAMELRGDIKRKELPQQERQKREEFAQNMALPARDATRYNVIDQVRVSNLLVGPSAHPMTPMYLLDKEFRILEWNEAFSLAFDRTMEGRQGCGILEWTYHLDNYEEVLEHGEKTFGNPDHPPCYDRETVVYTSLRYGRITAVKNAYQIVGASGGCEAWLVTLDPEFEVPSEKSRYRYELLQLIGLDQLWSEYAISYDRVLSNTRVYRDLIDTVLGIRDSPLAPIAEDARVLDFASGTGNLSKRMMEDGPRRLIFALDNNNIMLEFLRDKCREYLRDNDLAPGVLAIKQDVTSLFGLQDEYFDCVVANNVFYALADPKASLESVFRVLKPGGELRATGPRRDTDIDALFKRIRSDLEAEGKFEDCRSAYEHVEQINKLRLRTMLHQWNTDEFCALLESQGFIVQHRSDDIYAGQSMLVSAIKPDNEGTGSTLSKLQVQIK